jgi:DNA repair protein RecN (Recombination protein N)
MLSKLAISNYALIDSVEISFANGLSIITGETGAGKSIMLGALSMLLGGRGDAKVIRNKEKKSVIEATVVIEDEKLKKLFDEYDIDWKPEDTFIRREILPNGRSRAFINDIPVTLQLLADVTSRLIDIHSQHNNLLLSNPKMQLKIVDSIADNSTIRSTYKEAFHSFVELRAKVSSLKTDLAKNRQELDYMRFQLEQLDKLNPKLGELEEVERRFDILSDAEEIREKLGAACDLLSSSDYSIVSKLSEVRGIVRDINFSLLDKNISAENEGQSIPQRLESAYLELKDISETLEDLALTVDAGPEELARMEKRMNELYDARKRFHVESADDLVEMRKLLRERIKSIDLTDDDIADLERELKESGHRLKLAADALSETRSIAADALSNKLTELARPLGMSNLKFSVLITKGKLNSEGQDCAEFLCAFNKNQELMPISRVASGGEISRLMLSIKAFVAGKLSMPTVIFDEVDTGVSGEIADKMGEMMRDMGSALQVITITHLPQVAAKGTSHYKVYKADDADKTVTNIRQLTQDERVIEIAGMLSGSEINDAALSNARSLLGMK